MGKHIMTSPSDKHLELKVKMELNSQDKEVMPDVSYIAKIIDLSFVSTPFDWG